MNLKLTKYQEVKGGEIIIVTTKSILILVTATTMATDPNRTNIRTTDKVSSGGQKSKDSKITLTQESAHYVPTEFSSSFFKQFDLAMKLKQEELRKQERNSTQVNEITEDDLIQALGVTKDQMEKAAAMLGISERTKKSGNSSA